MSVILIFLILAGCTGKSKQNEPVELPQSAFIDSIFTALGNVYAIRSAEGYSYITTEFSNNPVCYQLVSLPSGRYSDAIWHDPTGRLYYSDGNRVYSCDLTGNERNLIWEMPEGTKKDFVNIAAAANDYLLIRGGYGEQKPTQSLFGDYTYWTYDYFSLNVKTGEAMTVLSKVPYHKLPIPLCAYENTIMLVQPTDKDGYNPILENETQGEETACVLSIDLLSGENKELGVFSMSGTISDADGVILDDRLYFVCERSGVYSLLLSGGEIERHYPDNTQAPGMDQFINMAKYNGNAYILMWDGITYPSAALCEWDRETGLLYPIATTDNTFSAEDFFIDSGTYVLFAGAEIMSGELS